MYHHRQNTVCTDVPVKENMEQPRHSVVKSKWEAGSHSPAPTDKTQLKAVDQNLQLGGETIICQQKL